MECQVVSTAIWPHFTNSGPERVEKFGAESIWVTASNPTPNKAEENGRSSQDPPNFQGMPLEYFATSGFKKEVETHYLW